MIKKFKVIVNGEAFEVEVEEVGATAPTPNPAPVAAPVAQNIPVTPNPKPVSSPAPASSETSKVAATGAANESTSPLPGTILRINVTEGQAVKAGQVVLVLEAMKMENEIVAPEDGIIRTINVSKGESVNTGDLLFVMG
ncbi:MAG: biotin/lipoyl-containing protein [Bacillota bacterium]